MGDLNTIILAAGEGKRMHTGLAKVLHQAAGKELLCHVLDSVEKAGGTRTAVIIGNNSEQVQPFIPEDVQTYYQAEQKGTGHAVMQALEFIKDSDGPVLVLNGDAPLTRPETIKELIAQHNKQGNGVTVLTAELEEPGDMGRIVSSGDEFIKIVEQKDASEEELAIKEVNSGVYCFNKDDLLTALDQITSDNAQNEYYLTDTIEIIRNNNGRAGIYKTDDADDIKAVNTRAQLAEVENICRKRVNKKLMESGVTLIDPNTTYIDADVKIEPDTIIYPGCLIQGKTIIGRDCIIGMNCHIKDSIIKDNVDIESSTILESDIDSGTHVGPYAYIRPDSHIGKDVKIGDFVEVKNSTVKDGAKASHLTYIGDAVVGKNVNLGCGTVFVNYDGKDKHQVIVEDDCFIGCNTNLVAPVTVKRGSYTAAGSTITDNVPEDTLAIARARQINKVNYMTTEDDR